MLPAMAHVLPCAACAAARLLSRRALGDRKKHVKSSSHAGNEKGDKKSQVEWRCFSPTTDSLEAEKLTSISSILMLKGRPATAWLDDCQCFVIPTLQFQNMWWESHIDARSWGRFWRHKARRVRSEGPGHPSLTPSRTCAVAGQRCRKILRCVQLISKKAALKTLIQPYLGFLVNSA